MADKIDVARKRPLVANKQIEAERRHELDGVSVQVDDGDLFMERTSFLERERHVRSLTATRGQLLAIGQADDILTKIVDNRGDDVGIVDRVSPIGEEGEVED